MKISIIVNVYKGTEQYLKECLDSIFAQTFKDFEIIVVVDGYTKPMIYPGTTTIIREENKGIAYSRESGVRLSRYDWILFVDADDVLSENFLEEMASQERWNKSDIIYPHCLLWSKWGESKLENAYFIPPLVLTLDDMKKQNYVVVTSLMKKEVYEKVGGFDKDLIIFEDYKFFLKAFVLGYKFNRSNCFLKYRQRTNSRNRANKSEKERIYNKIKEEVLTKKVLQSFKPRVFEKIRVKKRNFKKVSK